MRKLLATSAAFVLAGVFWGLYYHGVEHFLGIDTQQSDNYDFVSGVGPMIITAVGYTGIIGSLWHHLNCHTAGCPRLARFPVAGGDYKVCRKHHRDITLAANPHRELTVDVLRNLHDEHLRRQAR